MLPGCPAIDEWHRSALPPRRAPTVRGLLILVAGCCGFVFWAGTAPLDGAVVAPGAFVATGQNKSVQHFEGGIVREILVREGDLVEPNQALLRLDETSATAKLRRLVLRKYRLHVMQTRLEAEMQASASFDLPAALAADASDPEVQSMVARQQIELHARRTRQADEEQVLRKEIAGLNERIAGYQTLLETMQQRLKLFGDELKDKKALLDRNLVRKSDVLALERAGAGVSGELGDLTGRIADAKERIARAEQQIAQLRSAVAQKAAEELRATESELDDVNEQIRTARDVVERTEVRAPVRGVVVRVNHHTVGAVVAPGAVMLELLPVNEELIIEARVNPGDISHVQVGQSALVRLNAYNQRMTPMIEGTVIYVSADTLPDRDIRMEAATFSSRRQSFVARVRLDEHDARGKIDNFRALRHAGRRLHQDRRADVPQLHPASATR